MQLNLEFKGQQAAFLRVYQHHGKSQTALVVLNKGNETLDYSWPDGLPSGDWRDAFSGENLSPSRQSELRVPAHGVGVWLTDAPVSDPGLLSKLDALMARKVVR